MKKFYITIILTLLPLLIFAQGVNDNWYFGQNAGVNFSGNIPLALTDSQMYAEEATGTASDDNGKLLFYTNGVDVYNRQHQIMQNGTTIGGGLSTQQLVIVKSPANPKQYYIFTGAEIDDTNTYIAYTVVDMDLGNIGTDGHPLGLVLPDKKRIPILNTTGNKINTEAITVVMHSDHNSFWIVIPNQNNLYSYRLSGAGFNPTPVTSSLGLLNPLNETKYFGIKASPEVNFTKPFSNYISINMWYPQTEYMNKVYSFENSTGQITNHFTLNINTSKSYISEYSKYGNIFYLGQDKVYAVNLDSSISFPVFTQIFSGAPGVYFYGIQKNKYDDIYLSNFSSNYLSKINNPNNYGASSIILNSINLNGKSTYLGLPQPLFWSWAGATECIVDLALQNPEVHSNYTYSVSDYIITSGNYSTDSSNQSIIVKANNFILMAPNTSIKKGSDFLAKIAPCEILENKKENTSRTNSNQRISLNLDLRENTNNDNFVNIYPNPASDFIKIESKVKIISWEIYDISGKNILKGNQDRIDIKSLISGSYLININFEKGIRQSKKIIIK
ncbi:T9SS type A sorting domain-containing protein [Chryseobacterium mucoviscidosis]|uniref:T9SS type A sorting domain-containing protein n=1 Tax=Chryseobacterium mucoviscidosis TaxID=1945581 RepID=UPI0031D727A7